MKRLIVTGIFFFAYCITSLSYADSLRETTITVCDGNEEWPPFTYFQRDEFGNKTKTITGYSVELLTKILNENGIKVKFTLVPWKQCVQGALKAKTYQIALNATYTENRVPDFLMTDTFYTINTKFFYLKSKYPNGFPDIKTASELYSKGSVCGLQGYNYEGVGGGIDNNEIDRGGQNI